MQNRLGHSADLQNTSAASVPTPASGTLTIFSEGGNLKQKDSTGAVKDLSNTPVTNTQTGVSYTYLSSDRGTTIIHSNALAIA